MTEIVSLEIIEMPEMPDYIKGIINCGEDHTLMCVRTRFLKESRIMTTGHA